MATTLYTYRILEVLKVLDGDTFDFRVDLGFNLSMDLRVRLKGIDTPEMDSPEGEAAKEYSRVWLRSHSNDNQCLKLTTHKSLLPSGAFGRWLADVFCDAEVDTVVPYHLAEALIRVGHVKKEKE
jgi:micrococcal nuclease